MPIGKPGVERYQPGSLPDAPEGLIQFFYDELPRIAAALNKPPNGISVAETQAGVPITTIPAEFRLFEGEAPQFDLPGGGWDSVLGEWTVAATGLYQLNLTVKVEPFGAGNKDYACNLRLYINDIETWSSSDVGQDNFPLGAALSVSGRLMRESVVRATIELVHDQFVGSTTVIAFMGITSTALE